MDFDMFGFEGGFSFEDIGCEILILGPIHKEEGFCGESVWQATVLAPFGYEISLVDLSKTEEESQWLQEQARKIGVNSSRNLLEDARACKVISVNGLYADGQMDLPELKKILEEGKKNKAIICVDPGDFQDTENAIQILREIAPFIDYFLPNEEEARKLSGQSFGSMIAEEFRELGIQTLVMTQGAMGCFLRGEDAFFNMGTEDVEVKDTTGVGANFAAGFIYGLFQDWQMKTVCEFATACATVSATYSDPVEGAKTRKDEIKKMLKNPYM